MVIHDDGNGRATIASLAAQVSAIDRDYQELQRAVISLNTKLETSISSLGTKFESAIASLHNKLDAKTTTPWQTIWGAMSVGVMILIALGTALYAPIHSDTMRLDQAVAAIVDRGVFQRQYDADQLRTRDTFKAQDDQTQFIRRSFMRTEDYEARHKLLSDTVIGNSTKIEALVSRGTDSQGRLSRLEEFARTADKNIDILFTRNYKLATEPPPFGRKSE